MHYRKIIFIKAPILEPMVKTGFKVVFKIAEINLKHCIHQEFFIKKNLKKELDVRKFYLARFKQHSAKVRRKLLSLQMEDAISKIGRNISVVKAYLGRFDEMLEKTEAKISLLKSESRKLEKVKKQDPFWANKADSLMEGINKYQRNHHRTRILGFSLDKEFSVQAKNYFNQVWQELFYFPNRVE